ALARFVNVSHLDMLEFEQARTRILNEVRPLPMERVELSQALGRVLAVDLVAESPLPSVATSAMDGYALCVGDLPAGVSTPTVRVIGESRAGGPASALDAGSACRIFTGAVVPHGAD